MQLPFVDLYPQEKKGSMFPNRMYLGQKSSYAGPSVGFRAEGFGIGVLGQHYILTGYLDAFGKPPRLKGANNPC